MAKKKSAISQQPAPGPPSTTPTSNAPPPSKKRKSDTGQHNEPAKKKQKSDSTAKPIALANFLRDDTFKNVLAALNQDRARCDNQRLNGPLAKSKYASLIQVIREVQSHVPDTQQSIVLLAIVLLDGQFRVLARKAMDRLLGQRENARWLDTIRPRFQHLLPATAAQPVPDKVVAPPHDSAQQRPTFSLPTTSALPPQVTQGFTHPLDDGAGYGSDEAPSIGTVRSSVRRESLPSVGDATKYDHEDGEIVTINDSSGDVRLSQLSKEEQRLQTRYFGITDPNELIYCLNCSERGHMNTPEACPALSCSLCLTISHTDIHCPRQQKCLRCRRRGHAAASCTSPSVPAGGIGDECDLCGNLGHAEGECSYLWHSYRPVKGKLPQIPASQMRVSCYSCGGKGHWGGDCPRSTTKHDRRGIPWCFTAEHAALYIKPDEQLNGEHDSGPAAAMNRRKPSQDAPAQSGGLPAWQLRQLSDYA